MTAPSALDRLDPAPAGARYPRGGYTDLDALEHQSWHEETQRGRWRDQQAGALWRATHPGEESS